MDLSSFSGVILPIVAILVVLFLAWFIWKLIGFRIIGSNQVGVV